MANRRLLRTLVASLAFDLAEWALWVAVLVHAYEDGGAAAAGFAALGLLVPSALAAPIAGAVADGPRPERVLVIGYAAEAGGLIAATVSVYLGWPLWVVIAFTGLALAALTFARPSTAVVIPGLVSTPGELTAANLLTGWCDGVSVLLGPLAAAAVLSFDGPRAVFAMCAGLVVIAAAATVPLGFDRAAQRWFEAPRTERVRVRPALRAMAACFRSLAARPATLLLLIVLGGQFVLVGALDLVYVVIAVELLDIGESGTGYLSASFGAGAVFGAAVATLLVARRRLAPILLVSVAVIAGSMLLLGAVTTLVTALLLLPTAGLARSLLDLTGRMLMQRAAPQDSLASVFAALEAVTCVGMAIGAVLAQTLVTYVSDRAALFGVGVVFVLLLVATISHLRHVDAAADVPVVTIRLLRSLPLFAPLGAGALEALARASESLDVRAGDVVVEVGGVGDRYYAIVAGVFDVRQSGSTLRTLRRGDGFGEIALIADVPRTATVVAASEGTLIAIDRASFLAAVTGHDVAHRTAWRVATTYAPEVAPLDVV